MKNLEHRTYLVKYPYWVMTVADFLNAFDMHVSGLIMIPMMRIWLRQLNFSNLVSFVGVVKQPVNQNSKYFTVKHFSSQRSLIAYKTENKLFITWAAIMRWRSITCKMFINNLILNIHINWRIWINRAYQATILANAILPTAKLFMAL